MNKETLEFFVKMRDLVTGPLMKIAKAVKESDSVAKTYKNTLGSLYDRVNDLKKFRMDDAFGKKQIMAATAEIKKYEKQIDRLEGRSSTSNLFGWKNIRSLAMAAGITFGASQAFGFAKDSINSAMNFEATKKSFQVLTGSDSIGSDLSEKLRDLKTNTILGPSVYKNAQRMLSFGISSDKIIPDLKMLGDISMGDATKLGRLTLAFSEMESQGNLNGRRLLQMVNVGFNPLEEISKKTGKSIAELDKMMRKGAISASMVEDAIKDATGTGGRFNNMMNKMGETTWGKMKRFEGAWANLKITIGEKLLPVATRFLEWAQQAVRWIDKNIDSIISWGKAIGGTIVVFKALTFGLESYRGLMAGLGIAENAAAEGSGIFTSALKGQIFQIGLLAAAITSVITLYNYLGGAMDRAQGNANEFNQTAYDAEKRQLSNILGTYSGKNADKKKNLLLSQAAERLNNYINQTQQEFDILKAKEIKEGVGGKAFENIYHSLQLSGTQLSLYKSQLKAVTDLQNVNPTQNPKSKGDGQENPIAADVTGGGPRVININGVKFTDKIEFHVANMIEGTAEAERKLQDMFLRILNSGAYVQG